MKLHPKPFSGINNRKLTAARIKRNNTVQSIPIYEEGKFLGYKYIFHDISVLGHLNRKKRKK